jgi:hypothetical protein
MARGESRMAMEEALRAHLTECTRMVKDTSIVLNDFFEEEGE